jgi:drug/metabolite transporter (DMT)-like permease
MSSRRGLVVQSRPTSRINGRLNSSAIALAIFIMAIFGGSYTMVKVGLRDLPVFGSLLLRMLLAGVVLGIYMHLKRLPFAYHGRAQRFLIVQTVAFIGMQALLYLGLAQTTAGRGAILLNAQPFIALLLLPVFIPSERLTIRGLVGTAIAFAGVFFVLAERGVSGETRVGDFMVLAAAVCWAGNVIMNKAMPLDINPVSAIFWSVTGAVPVFLAMTLVLEPDATWRLTADAVFSVLYLGIFAAAFSFVAFVWLIQTYAANRVNVFVFLSPVFGVITGWLALDEQFTLSQVAGMLGVAAGIWFVNADSQK